MARPRPRREGDSAYAITYVAGDSASRFEGRLFGAGDARLLDLAPAGSDDFQVPGHALVRIWIEGSGLRWTFLDSDWLRDAASRQLPARAADEKNKFLLTAPGAAIRNFLVKHGSKDEAHGKVQEWRRIL